MPTHMRELAEDALKEKKIKLEGAKIVILGVAFLENSDDTRNNSTEPLYNTLKTKCKDLIAHDPYVKEYEDMKITADIETAVKGRDCIIVMTRHREYSQLKPSQLKKWMKTPIIIDGRNVFNQEECLKLGFSFRGVGLPRKTV
jgi:UDP-N-acetyl-D-mannosaminuronic acid dehydrogenase